MQKRKKILLIVLLLLVPILGASGFCVYWFALRPSSTGEITLIINGDETINFKSERKTTTIKIDTKGINANKITLQKSDDIAEQSTSGLTWSNFLQINDRKENVKDSNSLLIGIKFLNDIPNPDDFSTFHLYLQCVFNNTFSNKITINVFLRQQDLNRIFTITDLEQFSFLPNQAEILARAISLNQDRYNPSEFDNEPLVVNLSTDESAQLTCSNADLWTGTVALSWQVQFNPIDVNTIITNTDLSENHTQPFSEWPNYSDIIWRTEILNTDINHDHEWFATVFWPYVDVSISAKDTTRTATVTGAGFYWKNNVVLTFDIVGT